MATVEFYQKRLASKEKELETLNKKLARIKKAEEGNWETNNPYSYGPYDLSVCVKDIASAEEQRQKYVDAIEEEKNKAASRNVKPILDFLARWKAGVFEYYRSGFEKYFDALEIVSEASNEYNRLQDLHHDYMRINEEVKAAWDNYMTLRKELTARTHGTFEKIQPDEPGYSRWGSNKRRVAYGDLEYVLQYVSRWASYEEACAEFTKFLDHEANLRYDDIVNRTCAIVGQITDASNLSIGAKGDLNGHIIGTKGTAKVQTIGAGGYNEDVILDSGKHGQCFHYRTLINKIKNR